MVSNLVLFDTSVFIDNLRSGCHQQRVESLPGLVRTSSVVCRARRIMARGDGTCRATRSSRTLQKNHPILTPTEKTWLESGELLAKINAEHGYSPAKLRDLHFDVLIALTARSHGALLITSNRSDFELIRRYRSCNWKFGSASSGLFASGLGIRNNVRSNSWARTLHVPERKEVLAG